MEWFICSKDGDIQKLNEEVLIYKIENNEISPQTLVINENMQEWTKLENLEIYKNRVKVLESRTKQEESKGGHKSVGNGLVITSFLFALADFFIVMFISRAKQYELSGVVIATYKFWYVTAIILALSAIALIIIWFCSVDDYERYPDYSINTWKYLNGRKLAIITIILICFEIVYYILVVNWMFEPLFFSEHFFRELEVVSENSYY